MHPKHSLYKIFNEYGDRATILNYGARVVSLDINVNQNVRNIILGYSEMDDYINDSYYMGATIGRYSNRIKNSCYEKDGKKFVLSPNEGENQLHGGPLGFDRLIWSEHSKVIVIFLWSIFRNIMTRDFQEICRQGSAMHGNLIEHYVLIFLLPLTGRHQSV